MLSRDGGKTLATDTPDVVDVRRLSTRALRAERDRLAQLRADCPPDRSRELAWRPSGPARPTGPPAGPSGPAGGRRAGRHPPSRLLRRRTCQGARDGWCWPSTRSRR